eukprot:TRINITY_DN67381_c0_g1_i1.p1 TRINITY_DN67381_c0_g1~~TRINITY_DN67381_c0_g1_i1.p1  ORF type:complete len:275 (-),score=5.15 TRINITY_DN67381_c0_g1_i1:96-899(-)
MQRTQRVLKRIKNVPFPTTGTTQKLDIYLPPTVAPSPPVVIQIHGGGWVRGKKDSWFYGAPSMCRGVVKHCGALAVAGSYQLAAYPQNVQDVAACVTWVANNINKHGGDPSKIFLMGHSAGSHLIALLACDHARWLHPTVFQNIKGVICVSGLYTLPNPTTSALRNRVFQEMYLHPTFGRQNSSELIKTASPTWHVSQLQGELPPFLVLNAATDLGLETDGKNFVAALQKKNVKATWKRVPLTAHATIKYSSNLHRICSAWIKQQLL